MLQPTKKLGQGGGCCLVDTVDIVENPKRPRRALAPMTATVTSMLFDSISASNIVESIRIENKIRVKNGMVDINLSSA